jgi:hypothetical protein
MRSAADRSAALRAAGKPTAAASGRSRNSWMSWQTSPHFWYTKSFTTQRITAERTSASRINNDSAAQAVAGQRAGAAFARRCRMRLQTATAARPMPVPTATTSTSSNQNSELIAWNRMRLMDS